jgi:hypothetical protein
MIVIGIRIARGYSSRDHWITGNEFAELVGRSFRDRRALNLMRSRRA